MKLLFQEASQAENLYRLILDNALDAFIVIDQQGKILDWSAQAEKTFGWNKQDVMGEPLVDTIIPERYRAAHLAGIRRYLASGQGKVLNRRLEVAARRRDGQEILIELNIIPIRAPSRILFFASLRDISQRKALEEEIHRQGALTTSILNSMADAVMVADLAERIVLINPAAQRLLHLKPAAQESGQKMDSFVLFHLDGKTPYTDDEHPLRRALRGKQVDGAIALLRQENRSDDAWVSINARPLTNADGALTGAVIAFHDINELRRREEEAAHHAHLLQEQASLLDLAHDAIMARDIDNVITYWNRSAEKLYGYSREQAIGQVSHQLLRTRFPVPLEQIHAIVQRDHYWEGELIHHTRDGREITVFSQWALELHDGQPYRYLETNSDVMQRVQAERALRRSQQDFRLLVESVDHAIIVIDPNGIITSWNSAAERIFGMPASEAIGLSSAALFTQEDRDIGEPLRELEEARLTGHSEDDRWHIRGDGSRFWASGSVTPLWNDDGSLRGYAKIMRDQTTQRLAEEQTKFLANHDGLTGLPNRIHFSNRMHQTLALSQRTGTPMAVLLLDLDRFKHVNDTFGHHTGDLLLKEVALRIQSSIRETDFVARLGGDEFVIIQSEVMQPEAAETLARKLLLELGRPYRLEGQEIISGASIGIGLHPGDAQNSVDLLKHADLALYRAKDAGRHTYQVYTSELRSVETWKKDREAALRGALQNHQFELHYQPQVDLASWKISSVEALLRWRATEREIVLPGDFLEFAEQSGLIVEIGEWALREACHQVRRWQEQGLRDLRLSVNCSARQFNDPRFVAAIPAILRDAGIVPSCLELEVPEAMLARHAEIKGRLSELRALGIRITIDNFGTGTTALMDFHDFRIDVLKIDKAFVQHLPHRREDSAITSAIISLAHNLGISVSAGGVETAEQLAYLKARDCTCAQGFIFSPPVPAEKFEELMHSNAWSRINHRLSDMNETAGSASPY